MFFLNNYPSDQRIPEPLSSLLLFFSCLPLKYLSHRHPPHIGSAASPFLADIFVSLDPEFGSELHLHKHLHLHLHSELNGTDR